VQYQKKRNKEWRFSVSKLINIEPGLLELELSENETELRFFETRYKWTAT